MTTQIKKFAPCNICDPFVSGYYRTTMQVCEDLSNLSQIFYSSGKSLFPRLTTCTGSNPSAVYQFYKYGYMDMVYPYIKLTELSLFPSDIIQTLKTLKQ